MDRVMRIDLAGEWLVSLEKNEHERSEPDPSGGRITLPGCLQGAGYGYPVTYDTEWVSSLHNPFWYEREEYKYAQEQGCKVPFLSQPHRHFVGVARYERNFCVAEPDTEWILHMEAVKWRTSVFIDDVWKGGDCSLCGAHEICCGVLSEGEHRIRIEVDNRLQYPYRPDGHGVSDALGATWNGIAGEIALLSRKELMSREAEKKAYAASHPRSMEVKDGLFMVDGKPEYFRGTHFGGDYPLTGYPETDAGWWRSLMRTVKEWGFNFIRCHSCCPPEAAFLAADEENVYLQPECGMWNYFDDGIAMLDVLKEETVRILRQFGHHPSFALFSPTNEPDGKWYGVLREWVEFARKTDKALGYEGRRLYTAQSGWYYDVPPSEVTGTDYLYFHRSAFGPYLGGMIRNSEGWKGRDYNPSLEGARLPVICHELGQWCSYPDFKVMEKFTGYFTPGNYQVFRENARAAGVLPLAEDFAYCSGRNQVRMLKEDIEANFRTDHLYGFEMLDLHDYLGQGTALVGLLDAFWESKGYVKPEEVREFCGETVLLTRLPSYTYRNTEVLEAPVIVSHFGRQDLDGQIFTWKLQNSVSGQVIGKGEVVCPHIPCGENTVIHMVTCPLSQIKKSSHLILEGKLGDIRNHWDIYVFARLPEQAGPGEVTETLGGKAKAACGRDDKAAVVYTKNFAEAADALMRGETVLYTPYLSDMDYDCPPLSMKNTFWNAQMGPNWCRSMGISVQEKHPLFRYFPTEHDGGWQWEDILNRARGFSLKGLPEGIVPVVRAIDEWNRNTPQALILEAKVGKGRLILVSADLEGSFQERPAAYCLKQALLCYGAGGEYAPAPGLTLEQLALHICPLPAGRELILDAVFGGGVQITKKEALLDYNPNSTCILEAGEFPVTVTLELDSARLTADSEKRITGLLYMPAQNDRMFEGCIRDYQVHGCVKGVWVLLAQGTFQNSLYAQKAIFLQEAAQEDTGKPEKIRLTVLSCYGDAPRPEWEMQRDGWYRVIREPKPKVQFAVLSLLCTGEAPHSDEIFWEKHNKSNTKEIEN